MAVSHDTCRVVANIFISFIGAGVLGLPYAFKQAGLLEGVLVMLIVAFCSVKAMLLLIDCKYKVISVLGALTNVRINKGHGYVPVKSNDDDDDDNGKSSKRSSRCSTRSNSPEMPTKENVTYSDVGFAAFGHIGRYVIDTSILISQVGFCCAYLIFITENLTSYFPGVAKNQWLVFLLPPLFFLTLIPDLSKLAIFSLMAQVSNLLAFAVVFWFDFEHLHLAIGELKEFSLTGFPFFFSIAIYCFEGAGMILSLEQSVPEHLRGSFKYYFVVTITAVTTLYIVFGGSGYLSFGPETMDIITLNLPHEGGIDFAVVVKLCLCIALFFTYPVMLFPVTSLIRQRTQHYLGCADDTSKFVGFFIRFSLVTLTGLIVILVPRFADLMALIGATCCTLLAFIMPALCHLALFGRDLNKSQYGMDVLLVFVGVLGALLGTIDAVKTIMKS